MGFFSLAANKNKVSWYASWAVIKTVWVVVVTSSALTPSPFQEGLSTETSSFTRLLAWHSSQIPRRGSDHKSKFVVPHMLNIFLGGGGLRREWTLWLDTGPMGEC